MTIHHDRKRMLMSGMTLSEVVVAIAIISISIPLLLVALGSAYQSRMRAEIDTRSAWLVRDVQRQILSHWSESSSQLDEEKRFAFPSVLSPESSMQLSYRKDGTLNSDDTGQAVYMVSVEAKTYPSAINHPGSPTLAMIRITIQHPANASPRRQQKSTYQYLTTRGGIP